MSSAISFNGRNWRRRAPLYASSFVDVDGSNRLAFDSSHGRQREREREYYDRWPIQDRKIVVHFALMPACVGGAESLCANCWPLLFAGAEIAARFRIVGDKSSCSKRSTMITDRLGIDRLEKDSSRY